LGQTQKLLEITDILKNSEDYQNVLDRKVTKLFRVRNTVVVFFTTKHLLIAHRSLLHQYKLQLHSSTFIKTLDVVTRAQQLKKK